MKQTFRNRVSRWISLLLASALLIAALSFLPNIAFANSAPKPVIPGIGTAHVLLDATDIQGIMGDVHVEPLFVATPIDPQDLAADLVEHAGAKSALASVFIVHPGSDDEGLANIMITSASFEWSTDVDAEQELNRAVGEVATKGGHVVDESRGSDEISEMTWKSLYATESDVTTEAVIIRAGAYTYTVLVEQAMDRVAIPLFSAEVLARQMLIASVGDLNAPSTSARSSDTSASPHNLPATTTDYCGYAVDIKMVFTGLLEPHFLARWSNGRSGSNQHYVGSGGDGATCRSNHGCISSWTWWSSENNYARLGIPKSFYLTSSSARNARNYFAYIRW